MTSHIVFDSSHVSDNWDWLESILIMIDQEMWYDPTLGHSHLREFFMGYAAILLDTSHQGTYFLVGDWFFRWPLCQGILLSTDDGFESWPSLKEDYMSFFTLEHEAWLAYFSWCTLRRDIFLNRWCILGHSHSLEVIIFSFHIGVQDMTGWFSWCDYRSITFSSWLTDFWDDWIKTQTLVRACNRV